MTDVLLRAHRTHAHVGHTLDRLWDILSSPFTESWSSWSEWSHCDSNGAQMRVRHCDVLFPTGNQCSGNNSETRPCSPDSNFIPGDLTHAHTVAFFFQKKVSVTHAWLYTHILHHHMPTAVTHFQQSCDNEMCYWSLWGTLPRSEVRFIVRAALLVTVEISVLLKDSWVQQMITRGRESGCYT